MSSCRCADIKQCKENIQKLESAAEEIDHLATPYVAISDKLDLLKSNAAEAYDADNMDSFGCTLVSLKDDMRDAMDACQAAIGRSIDKLKRELSDMEEEDEEYHEEEEEEESLTAGTGQSGT